MPHMTCTLIATSPLGLEAIVAREVRALGYTPDSVDNGRVVFAADALGICRANLFLRSADRVMLRVGEFAAETFDELFEGVRALPWAELLPVSARFPVEGRSVKSQLASVPSVQAVVKKAVAVALGSAHGLTTLPETGALFAIEVALRHDRATLAIDTTGPGLHRRGYRSHAGVAPMKETLAAALVQIARWHGERPFVDPLCGSGTIAIEAALIARDIAPGLNRTFACERFDLCSDHFAIARAEARDRVKSQDPEPIYASDIDPVMCSYTAANAARAGVLPDLRIVCQPVRNLNVAHDFACLVTNPPYGEHLGDRASVRGIARDLADVLRRHPTWSLFALTADKNLATAFGRPPDKRRKLYNGRIECQLLQFFGPFARRS
jgi:putative N6-adenine-specific DNA methylase